MFGRKEDKPTTLEEVKRAYENLSDDDKKSFHQSISDRIHESVGEQEEEHGEKDSQTAADREHEALGAEHADGEGDVNELHETDKPDEEDSEDSKKEEKAEESEESKADDVPEWAKSLIAEVQELKSKLGESTEKKDVEEKADEIYGLGHGVFQSENGAAEKKNMSAAELRQLLGKITR